MINIIQNDSVKNHELSQHVVIFTSKHLQNDYKRFYLNKDVLVTTVNNYVKEVFNHYNSQKLINDEETFILMNEAFNNVKSSLSYYEKIENVLFINNLIQTYNDYLDYNLMQNEKMLDLKKIYDEFKRLLNINNFVLYSDMIEYLNNSIDLLKEKAYIFENVNNLNNVEISFIKSLSIQKNVTIYAITFNNRSFIKKLQLLNDNIRYENSDNGLINSLFDDFPKKTEDFKKVLITSNNDLFDEVCFVKNDITKKVKEGLSYKDIAIVSRDITTYFHYFDLLLDIPYYKEKTSGFLTKRFIEILCKIFNGDFSCSCFVSLLKLDLFDYSDKMINMLDNYVYTWDLEEEPFYNDFIYNPSGNKKTFTSYDKEELEKLNEVRKAVLLPIKYLLDNVLKETSKEEVLKYFYTYLDEEGITKKIYEKDEEGYNNFISNLEIINDLCSSFDFTTIINLLNSITKVIIKKEEMIDEVLVCSLEEMIGKKFKQVYFIGVTEENTLTNFKINSLINTEDLCKNNLLELILENNDYQKGLVSNVFLSDNVTITYYKLSEGLSKVNASQLIKDFPVKVNHFNYDFIYEKKLLFNKYSALLSQGIIKSIEIEQTELGKLIKCSKNRILNKKLSDKTVQKLYGKTLVSSPSSIETYFKCAYSYFCSYGLKLKVKEKNTFDKREVGTFTHYVLEKIIKNDFYVINDKNVDLYVNKYALTYLIDTNKKVNHTNEFIIRVLSKNISRLIKNIISEFNDIKFKPKYFEFKIKQDEVIKPLTINIKNGNLIVGGTVDRVDTYEDINNCYYRIIDYKTGNKEFRLDDVLIGLNMQMLIYLLAIKNNVGVKKMIPTGLLYYPAFIPCEKVSRRLNAEEKVKIETNKLRMNGLINRDYLYLYNAVEDKYVEVLKSDKTDFENTVSSYELELIFQKVMKELETAGTEILSGLITINPILSSRCESCEYCKFKSICKFDKNKDLSRKIKNYKNSEVINMLEGEKNA
ncbi:MAG: PD-(D/E)XK nuclease family protein [Bacilli bacterium]